jgi:hypothetical protein
MSFSWLERKGMREESFKPWPLVELRPFIVGGRKYHENA